ncbi:MAG TPA: endonuclease/exonuclease/phosphatase family protein [Acidimicrobiales bacterium]|jgi:endonuclease/exonuclease/phosphatase family metal-dependent hydrolase
MDPPDRTIVVASFNVHAGIDGWGRSWDLTGAVRRLDADVIVLQEVWWPDGRTSMATEVGEALGYRVLEHPLAAGRRASPHPRATSRWMRPLDWRGTAHALYLDSERAIGRPARASERYATAERGRWGLAVLSRLPVLEHRVIQLGRLPRDRVTRAVLVAAVEAHGADVLVAGTHMSHLTYGSPLQFIRLGRALRGPTAGRPAVLAGDMNLWGPPASLLLPGWHRAVSGRTWPAWRPHSQVDHLFVKGPLVPTAADVLPDWGSDHRAVRATLTLARR